MRMHTHTHMQARIHTHIPAHTLKLSLIHSKKLQAHWSTDFCNWCPDWVLSIFLLHFFDFFPSIIPFCPFSCVPLERLCPGNELHENTEHLASLPSSSSPSPSLYIHHAFQLTSGRFWQSLTASYGTSLQGHWQRAWSGHKHKGGVKPSGHSFLDVCTCVCTHADTHTHTHTHTHTYACMHGYIHTY